MIAKPIAYLPAPELLPAGFNWAGIYKAFGGKLAKREPGPGDVLVYKNVARRKRKRLPKGLLTVDEAANYSGLSSSGVRKLIRRGRLKAKKLGGRVVIKRSWIEEALVAIDPQQTPQPKLRKPRLVRGLPIKSKFGLDM